MTYAQTMTALLCSALVCAPKFTNTCFAQDTDSELVSMYEQTLDNYQSERFDEAIHMALAIREKYPDEPAGALGLLTTYQTISRNYRVKTFDAKIDSLLDLSVKLAKKAVKRNRKDGKNYFYLGCAYGFRSIERAKQKDWMAAFRDGSQVPKCFKKALAYSPDFYDSYYGLGLFQYWSAAKGAMRYLPFAQKNRNEGIEQMKLVVEKGHFLKPNAKYGLIAAYVNEEEYDKALALSDDLVKVYPNNPTLFYRRGRIFEAMGRWDEAAAAFTRLHEILVAAPYQSISYQMESLFQIAKCEYESKDYYSTQARCSQALVLEKQLDFSRELDGPVESFDDIKSQLHDLQDKVNSLVLTQAGSN